MKKTKPRSAGTLAPASGAILLLAASGAAFAEENLQNAEAVAAAVNTNEPNKGAQLSGNSDSFTYNDNHFVMSNQELLGFAYAEISQACAIATCSGMDQGGGDVAFGAESMKLFAGSQNVAVETASGGLAQAQSAMVVHGTVQLTNP